jgi:hypothetical protein
VLLAQRVDTRVELRVVPRFVLQLDDRFHESRGRLQARTLEGEELVRCLMEIPSLEHRGLRLELFAVKRGAHLCKRRGLRNQFIHFGCKAFLLLELSAAALRHDA